MLLLLKTSAIISKIYNTKYTLGFFFYDYFYIDAYFLNLQEKNALKLRFFQPNLSIPQSPQPTISRLYQ